MPPFRTGLKRKPENAKKQTSPKETLNSKEYADQDADDLLRKMLGEDADDSDSEDGGAYSDSDGEQEQVLFHDDSKFNDDSECESNSDSEDEQSTDLTDSDEDEDTGSVTEDLAFQDSDSESGIGQTHSDSSDVDIKTKGSRNIEKLLHAGGNNKKPASKKQESKKKNKTNKSTDLIIQSINENHNTNDKGEYESGDSSDEEDRVNTVGEVPMWWYNDYPHIGYNLDGKKIIKPPTRTEIDEFLKKCEDPDFWRTVRDPKTGQDIVLSKQDLELIARIKEGRAPTSAHEEYAPWVDWFTSEVLKMPVRAFPEHKRSFLPSKSDEMKISKMVHALKMGWMKTRKELAQERRAKKERQFYMLWKQDSDEEQRLRGIHKHIPAPKRPLPTHAESYNPPPEYLLDNKEMKEWRKLELTPWKRKYTFLPTKYKSLREVPSYDRYIRERFLRCLDLYLAPRAIKMKLTISPQDLVPKLPSPRDLQPFPTTESLVYRGHTNMVRSIDTDPSGQYLVSGSDDQTVKVWELSTGRCLRTLSLDGVVRCVAWIPVHGLSLVAVCCNNRLVLYNPGAGVGDHRVSEKTDELLVEAPPGLDVIIDERTSTAAEWCAVTPEEWALGIRISITHFKEIKYAQWHGRGDYIVVTVPGGASRSVLVHQLSKRRSQVPFNRSKGLVQCALFHPVRPFLFVATQRVVRIYDLVKQELVKKLLTGAQWISHMCVHPAGDNLLVASYDRKMMWFDLDLSSQPYQTLRLHGTAVRSVAFHTRYPLFASAGDDLKVIVSHGMVYNDLLQNPLIVPLKQLYGHEAYNEFGILSIKWHPYQPWILSAGADKTIRLYT